MQTIYLAGGCFWGLEKFLAQFRGVESVESGYANGPEGTGKEGQVTYQEVCAGSGHAETVKVVYDEAVLPTEKLLDCYFRVIDPLAVNRQGPDVGVQYRTGVYYEAEELDPIVDAFMDKQMKKLGEFIAVEWGFLDNYCKAEEYHQQYLKKNPYGYCHIQNSFFHMQDFLDMQEEKEKLAGGNEDD